MSPWYRAQTSCSSPCPSLHLKRRLTGSSLGWVRARPSSSCLRPQRPPNTRQSWPLVGARSLACNACRLLHERLSMAEKFQFPRLGATIGLPFRMMGRSRIWRGSCRSCSMATSHFSRPFASLRFQTQILCCTRLALSNFCAGEMREHIRLVRISMRNGQMPLRTCMSTPTGRCLPACA